MPRRRAGAVIASALAAVLLAACAPQPVARLAHVPAPPPDHALRTTGTASIALTFDDGPDPLYTPRMLDLLRRHGVRATFCIVGSRVPKYAAVVSRIVAEGHTLCNHSWRHRRDLGTQDEATILDDLTRTNEAIARAVPGVKIRYFRAPYGSFSPRLVAVAGRLGMTSIHWSLDTNDWDADRYGHGPKMVRHIVAKVRHHARPGAIILAHDLRKPDTITAMDQVIPWLKARFTIAPLPGPDPRS